MAPKLSKVTVLGVLALTAALLWRPLVLPVLIAVVTAPFDAPIGEIPVLSSLELSHFYENKSALVVGGTRGTGHGTALALVKAGAHVTVVGRRTSTGQGAVEALKGEVKSVSQQVSFLQGDIGTVKSTLELVEVLKESVQDTTITGTVSRFDFLIVSAGIFPDWASLKNEDGLEKSYGIAVVGRFLLYRNMQHFLKPSGRVLNILASGQRTPLWIDREMALGNKNPKMLMEAIINFNTAHEVMLIGLDERDPNVNGITRISTHPGVIATELHQGQGWFMDKIMGLGEALLGISVEECGLRQATILAFEKFPRGKLSYVDNFNMGRKRQTSLQKQVDKHLDWLWQELLRLEESVAFTR